ncbi:hypothetical protein DFH09DRAFT_1006415 [Mycena vulgaris]|nr:hypothetical protein DFH09DRAFT_1006415 [Mycena vulgaris]
MSLEPDLAQELIDTILDFLHDDLESLLASSLVARKWVPAPRYHIFERIAINHFVAGRRGHPGHRLRNTAWGFLELCGSPHCTLLPSVQNVVLNINTESPPSARLLEDTIHVLARAPVKKILFIDHTGTSSIGVPISLSWIAPFFPGLQEFVYNALHEAAEDVLALVALMPTLRTLSVYSRIRGSSTTAIARVYPVIPHTVFTHLHTLRLKLSSHDSVISWLHTLSHPLRLETLDVNIFHCYHNGWGAVAALNSLLHATGEHLRHLTLRISYEDSLDDDIDDLLRLTSAADGEVDLSGLNNLRSLHLNSHNVEAICATLTSLPDPGHTLETLEVDFASWIYYDELPCLCDPGFLVHEFSTIMRGDQFTRLAAFVIRVPDFFGDRGRMALREYFPRWKDTEVLNVGFMDSSPSQIDSWETVDDLLFGSTGV